MDRGPIECPNLRFFSLLSSFDHPMLGFYDLVCRDFPTVPRIPRKVCRHSGGGGGGGGGYRVSDVEIEGVNCI